MMEQRPEPPKRMEVVDYRETAKETLAEMEQSLGKIPNPLSHRRTYEVVLIEGDCTLSAHDAVVWDGALMFLDDSGDVVRAWAPGEWHSMQRQDATRPKKEVDPPRKGLLPGSPGYGPGPAS